GRPRPRGPDRPAARGRALDGDLGSRADRHGGGRLPHTGDPRGGAFPAGARGGDHPHDRRAVSPRCRAREGRVVIRHLRVVRVLRVWLALARVVPRYLLLQVRARSGRLRPRAADWERAHAAAAREMERIALAYAGAFTKAAQVLGARADVFPAPFIERLGQFHDAVPPRPFARLAPLVERDLRRPLAEVFASVEPEALAAASLAQVHRATLHDGSRVVIKIQYPEIHRIIPLD